MVVPKVNICSTVTCDFLFFKLKCASFGTVSAMTVCSSGTGGAGCPELCDNSYAWMKGEPGLLLPSLFYLPHQRALFSTQVHRPVAQPLTQGHMVACSRCPRGLPSSVPLRPKQLWRSGNSCGLRLFLSGDAHHLPSPVFWGSNSLPSPVFMGSH